MGGPTVRVIMPDEIKAQIVSPVPFRLRAGKAVPLGWPPEVAPNEKITATHTNRVQASVYEWPGDVDGKTHTLRNVHLEAVTGVLADPTTAPGDLMVRSSAGVVVRLPVGGPGQVLTVNAAVPTHVEWAAPLGAVASVFGRMGAIVAQAGDYTAAQVTDAVDKTQAYSDPPWITSIGWGKVSGAPATMPPSAHTHDAAEVVSGRLNTARLGNGIADETVFLRGDGNWTVPPGGAGGGGAVASVFGRVGAVTAQTGDYTAAQVSGAVVDPTLSLGDLMVRGAAGIVRLPIGANGMVLQADSAQPAGVRWGVASGGPGVPTGLTDGDILQWVSGAWAILPVGTVGQVLLVNSGGTGLRWGAGGGGSQTPWLTDIDGGNHALSNVSSIVSNGLIRSVAGGFRFPDGTTQVTAAVPGSQTPWTSDINAAGFRLLNTGNVGIGTANPGYPLDVAGSVRVSQGVLANAGRSSFYAAGEPYAVSVAYSAAQAPTDSFFIGVSGNGGTGGGGKFTVSNAGGVPLLSATPSGNVGIGTANPITRFTVAKDAHLMADVSAAHIALIGSTNANKRLMLGYDTTTDIGLVQAYESGGPIKNIALNPLGGHVGINRADPAYALDVTGTVRATNFIGAGLGGVSVQTAYNSSQRALNTIYQNTTGKPLMVTASVTISGGTYPGRGGAIGYADSATSAAQIVADQMIATTGSAASQQACVTFWVLPGYYYRVGGATATGGGGAAPTVVFDFWTEWY